MTVSKVNFICDRFSYAPAFTTGAAFQELILKFMVTGFDPLTIESITVLDNVARVVTSEKAFYSVPGVKMNIDGTGVPEIDTRQEISEVFSDGFSFEVEASNGTYTNGLTYTPSPLGWSLVQQDSKRLLLRSGSGATQEFNFLIDEMVSTANANQPWKIGSVYYDANNFNECINGYPGLGGMINRSLLPINMAIGYGDIPMHYWLYGDDAVVVITGLRTNFWGTKKGHYGFNSVFAIGEIINTINDDAIHYCGGTNDTGTINPYYGNFMFNYCNVVFGGDYQASTPSYWSAYGFRLGKNMPYVQFAQSRSPFPYVNRSGAARAYSLTTRTTVRQIEIADSSGSIVGKLPGVYAVDGKEIPTANPNAPLIPKKLILGNNKKRNCVFVGAFGSSSLTSSASFVATYMLNLTGPIR